MHCVQKTSNEPRVNLAVKKHWCQDDTTANKQEVYDWSISVVLLNSEAAWLKIVHPLLIL